MNERLIKVHAAAILCGTFEETDPAQADWTAVGIRELLASPKEVWDLIKDSFVLTPEERVVKAIELLKVSDSNMGTIAGDRRFRHLGD